MLFAPAATGVAKKSAFVSLPIKAVRTIGVVRRTGKNPVIFHRFAKILLPAFYVTVRTPSAKVAITAGSARHATQTTQNTITPIPPMTRIVRGLHRARRDIGSAVSARGHTQRNRPANIITVAFFTTLFIAKAKPVPGKGNGTAPSATSKRLP